MIVPFILGAPRRLFSFPRKFWKPQFVYRVRSVRSMRSHSFVERVPWLFSMRGWLLWTAPLAFNGHTAKYFSWFSFFLLFIICFGLPATSCRLSVPCWVALRFSLFTLFLCQKEKKNAPETHVNKKVAQQAHDAGVDLLATDQTKEGRQVIHVNGSQVSGPERTNPENGVPLRRFYSVLFVVFFCFRDKWSADRRLLPNF